jgi:hypothetical protein
MADTKQKATFELELEDDMSKSAESAAGALERLRKQIDDDSRALADMQKAMRNLQGGTVVNVNQFRKLKEQIDLKKASIAKAQGSFVSLGGTFGKTGGSSRGLESRLAALREQMSGMPGPIGGAASSFSKLSTLIGGGAITLGLAGIVAGLAALVVGLGVATAALYKYGTAQAEAARDELLRLEGLTKMRMLFSSVPGNAKEMQSAIDQVSASSALGRDKIAKYSESLYRMGLRGQNLTDALGGVAIKASVQGDAAASAWAGWAASVSMAGGSVKKLADRVRTDLGGIADKQLNSSAVQAEKLKESYGLLFADLGMEKFLAAWRSVNELMSQNTASGRALKQLVEHILQPLIDSSTTAAPLMKRFFQGIILGALNVEIAILDLRLWFKRTFGDVELFKGIDKMNIALKIGKGVLYTVVGLLGLVGVAVGAAFAIAAAQFTLISLAIKGVIDLVSWFIDYDWGQLGIAIIDGIVKPLKAGYAIIGEAMTGLADSALASFKSVLGIASPSKVFARTGVEIPRGVAAGVEQGTPDAREAVEAMVPDLAPAPASAGGTATPAGGGVVARGAVTVSIGEVNVHASSADPRAMALDFKRELEAILQSVAAHMGAPEPEGVPSS